VIGGHRGLMPKMVKLAVEETIEAYNLPIGAIAHLCRDTAAGKPGMLSHVGIGAFVDPRIEGGKLNKRTTEDPVRVMEVDGKEWLYYKSIPLNVADRGERTRRPSHRPAGVRNTRSSRRHSRSWSPTRGSSAHPQAGPGRSARPGRCWRPRGSPRGQRAEGGRSDLPLENRLLEKGMSGGWAGRRMRYQSQIP
jgi:hypothetical protein